MMKARLRSESFWRFGFVALVTFLEVNVARALPPPPAALELHRAAGAIKLDGDLSDEGWRGAAVIDHFFETSPADNTPAKVRTVAWITFDNRYLYVAVEADDPEPSRIHAPFVARDAVLAPDDNIAIFLDTRNDRRSALELRVNPRGIQGDAVYDDANGSEDFSPDFFYDTAAQVTAKGWSAEFRIPFSSLRYSDAPTQTWGILVWRNYPRDYRYFIHSAPIARESTCLVCHAHPITGLVGLPAAGNLAAAPYVSSTWRQTPDVATQITSRSDKSEAGLDLKWTPNANQAVDVTLNPDFSQIESDVLQINANTRFALSYPEKRPFFLEAVDLFHTPLPVVYTRSITAPRWGIRSTGQVAGSSYTLLAADDRGGGAVIIPGEQESEFAPQDFRSKVAVARLRHDLGNSFVGLVATDREISGGGYSRLFGPDLQWRPNDRDTFTAQVVHSDSQDPRRPDLSEQWLGGSHSGTAFTAEWYHQVQRYDADARVVEVGSGFRSDDGFMPQVGYRHYEGNVGARLFYTSGPFRFVRPYLWPQVDVGSNGLLSRMMIAGLYLEGRRNLSLGLNLHPREAVRVGSTLLQPSFVTASIALDPGGRIPHLEAAVRLGQAVDFVNHRVGDGTTLRLDSTIRPGDRMDLDLHLATQWLSIEGTRLFSVSVVRLKSTYGFSSRSSLRAIGQYSIIRREPALYPSPVLRREGSFNGSVVYAYRLSWQTALIAGYGDERLVTEENDFTRPSRSLFVKLSYVLQR